MANVCTTDITFNSNEEGINWLENQIEILRETKYEDRVEKFFELFKSPGIEDYVEAMGSKWVDFGSNWERDGDECYILQTESAWNYPDQMIKNIVAKLLEFDDTSNATGRYWDETYSPIGIFECNSTGLQSAETNITEDQEEWEEENPDGYFFEEVVERAFYDLEL